MNVDRSLNVLQDSSALYIADRAGFTDDIHTTTQWVYTQVV